MASKVACVEDYDSVVQEAVPSSRREAFRKRQSGLTSVTNSSDTGTVDSGYSSNSTANNHGEHFPESPIHSASPSYEDDDHTTVDSAPPTRPSPPQPTPIPSSKQDGRQSRSSNSHRMSGGSYSHGHPLRPHSRAASKSMRDGRASPAFKCPPINTSSGTADENCDCPDCSASTSAKPSPMLPSSSALETPWNLDMPSIPNGLPYVNTSQPWATAPLSSSPGSARGLGGSKGGFPFETFPTPAAGNSGSGLGGSRPSSYVSSSSNPLASSWTNHYNEYVSSPAAYTPTTGVNSIHSPPPYMGSSSSSNWVPLGSSVLPGTPSSARGPSFMEDYAPMPYHTGEYNLYGSGSGAGSARDGSAGGYTLPPRSASVQPVSNLRGRQRSSSYHHQGDMDFSSMPLSGPSSRRPTTRPPGSKRSHAPAASYDSRYDNLGLYDAPYDAPTDPTYDDYAPPTPPINRRLSRTSTLSGGLLPGDIARATSVPAENYVTDIQRARRNTNITPQPLAITARERGRRGSNSSGGLSSSQRRAQHDAMLDNLAEQVIVEPRPGLEIAKRDSSQQIVPADYDYDDAGYNDYIHYGNNDGGHPEDALVVRDPDMEPYGGRYPSTGVPAKYNYHGGDTQRSLRLAPERRHSISRAYIGDYYQPTFHLQSAGNELEHIRHTTKSRGAGSERRIRTPAEFEHDGYI